MSMELRSSVARRDAALGLDVPIALRWLTASNVRTVG